MTTIRDRLTENPRPLPLGWRWARLGDYALKIGSGLTPLGGYATYRRAGIPLIRSQNVQMNRFTSDGLVYVSREQDAEMGNSRVLAGDVLLNITGASIGRVCVVPSQMCPANVNQHVAIIRCDSNIDPAFLSYYISAPDFQRFVIEAQAGATRQALTKSQIEEFQIPLPTLLEQNRIVTLVNEQMAEVEQARVAAEVQLRAARALCTARLRAVFDNRQSSPWPRSPLGRVADLLASRSIASDGDTPVQAITTACLTEMGFSASGVKAARMWRRDVPECTVLPNEVLVARSNTPELVGRVSRFEGEPAGVVASDLTIRIRAKGELLPGFLSGYLSFLYLSGYWKERSGGASGSMKKITREQIQAELIPVPPKATQQEVDARIKRELLEARQLQSLMESQLATIDALPMALLRQAFNGEL